MPLAAPRRPVRAPTRYDRRATHAAEPRLRRPIQVGVEDRDALPLRPQRLRELHGERALADAALARANGDQMPDPRQALGDAGLLGDDLPDDVRIRRPRRCRGSPSC